MTGEEARILLAVAAGGLFASLFIAVVGDWRGFALGSIACFVYADHKVRSGKP